MPPEIGAGLGRMILLLGLVLVAVGLFMVFAPRLPGFLGRLPGDLSWSRGNVRIYFPLGTCLLLSLVLTAVVAILSWLRR